MLPDLLRAIENAENKIAERTGRPLRGVLGVEAILSQWGKEAPGVSVRRKQTVRGKRVFHKDSGVPPPVSRSAPSFFRNKTLR